MVNKKLLLFDFDGTIADTIEPIVHIVNEHAQEYGIKEIDSKDLKRLRGKTPQELIFEFKVPLYKVPFFVGKVRSELSKRMDLVAIQPKMVEVLQSLKKSGYTLDVMTSNSKENVMKFFEQKRLTMFDFIYSNKNIFGKTATLNHILHQKNIKSSGVIYIGDEVRDIQACQKLDIPIIAVSWGFNTKEVLERHRPTAIVTTPAELLTTINQLA